VSLSRHAPERSLATAYATSPGCPQPEVFVAAAWDALDADERRLLERHLEDCPACAAERELARSFESPIGNDAPDPDVEWVVAELARARLAPAARRGRFDWGWASAAAVVLLAAGGYVALREGPPPLAPPSARPVVLRGADIELIAPRGDIATVPVELRFAAIAGAARYQVKILGVDDGVLWEQAVPSPPATIPAIVRDTLAEAVVYRFQVEAFDANGARLAVSATASFRVVPSATASGGTTP